MIENLYDEGKAGAYYWLARHAKSPHNKYDRAATFAGSQVDNELTDEGILDTEKLAEEIINHKNSDFGFIVCSTMKRSRQTAEIIANKLNSAKKSKIPVITINDFNEINVGDFTGHTQEEVTKMHPKAAESFYSGDIKNWNFPNGEEFDQLLTRVKSVFSQVGKLQERHKGNVFLVGHGMFNRVILSILLPEKPELWQERSYPHDKLVIFNEPEEF